MVDHETLRRWLIQEGHWKKKRRHNEHRSRRERRKHFGELVQMDGSHHAWFGDDRPRTCLMELVDDSTGTVLAMDEQETTELAMGRYGGGLNSTECRRPCTRTGKAFL
jgi:hypothetical protein